MRVRLNSPSLDEAGELDGEFLSKFKTTDIWRRRSRQLGPQRMCIEKGNFPLKGLLPGGVWVTTLLHGNVISMCKMMLRIRAVDDSNPSLEYVRAGDHIRLGKDTCSQWDWPNILPIVRFPSLSKYLAKRAAPWFSISSEMSG